MSDPNEDASRDRDSYVEWLEACDEAIARGRAAPLDSATPREQPEPAEETLKLLRRLDGLRARDATSRGQPCDPAAAVPDTEVAPPSGDEPPAPPPLDPTVRDDFPAEPLVPPHPARSATTNCSSEIARGGMGVVYRARQRQPRTASWP